MDNKIAFRLMWWNGDETEFSSVYVTDAPVKKIKSIIKNLQKKETYTTTKLFKLLEKEGFSIKPLKIENLEF